MPKDQERGTAPPRRREGGMTVSEAGRRGGETVRDKYGPQFYSEIGSQSHKNDPGRRPAAGAPHRDEAPPGGAPRGNT